MPRIQGQDIDEEPAGIVISRGTRAEATPRFWAYIWGQYEETVVPAPTPTTEAKAA